MWAGGIIAYGRNYPFPMSRVGSEKQRESVRKMMGKEDLRRVKEEGHHFSGSTSISNGNLNPRKNAENWSAKPKLISKRDYNLNQHPLDVEASSFVTFNADYFVAKPHPPKNNGGKCL